MNNILGKISRVSYRLVAAFCSVLALPVLASAQSAPIYKNANLVMGYVSPGQPVNVAGYSQCFTSIGDTFWLRSDNSANIHPRFEVTRTNDTVQITKNRYADGRGAYVCHNDTFNQAEVTAGYVASGTNIGAGLACVVSIANFSKRRVSSGTLPGSVSCSYDSATGRISTSASQAGGISSCGYVCVKPSSAKTTRAFAKSYPKSSTGTENIGSNLSCALGTNYFFTTYSGTGVGAASYDPATGIATKGRVSSGVTASFSYLCASPAQSQCSDGVDNDRDGAIDLADFSCQNDSKNNDESLPKAQCQDGIDNDGDGAIDLADFSCQNNSQKNDESFPKAECQDSIDNDGDGAIDLADFSCQNNSQKNDESSPKAECQDGIDNDGDGAIDLADFSCTNSQDNDESNPNSQCQDGIDNDEDGLVDTNDPGCSNNQDNSEGDEPSMLEVGVECVSDNQDGTFTAYFGYENPTDRELVVESDSSAGTANQFSPGEANRGQTTTFKTGRHKGSVRVTFDGAPLTWKVRAAGGRLSTATASLNSTPCERVTPTADCINGSASGLVATFGYNNPNGFDVVIPVGPLNSVSPAPANRGQPTVLKAGRNAASFTTGFTKTVTWNLDGAFAAVNESTPVCDGGCIDKPIGTIKNELNQTALDLAALTKKAAKLLARRSKAQASKGLISAQRASQAGVDAKRAAKKADALARRAQALTLGFPEVIKACPFSPPFCQTVDRGETIEALRGLFVEQLNQIRRIMARRNFKQTGRTSREDPLVLEARSVKTQGDAQLSEVPRIATECD